MQVEVLPEAPLDGWQSSNAPVLKTERGSHLRGCNSYTIRQLTKRKENYETSHSLPEPVAL
jgi:hypothetical protein